MRIASVLVLAACSSAPKSPPEGPPAAPAKMTSFTMNGYTLTGAEYWPYVGSADIRYPEEVLWGFYPQQGVVPEGETDPNPASARPEAIACAEKAYAALRAFIASDPPKLKRIIQYGMLSGMIVPRFYLWTNDYGRAATPYPPGVREARLWWWARKQPEPPKPPGYWKWESTVTQSGECQIPHQPQIDEALTAMVAQLEKCEQREP
jgi:hypothetical protein